jgi:uncharacterized protein (DUF2147 family)
MVRAHKTLTAIVLAIAALCIGANVSGQSKAPAGPSQPGDEILGEWWTEGNEGRVKITRDKEGFYRGTTTCCEHENSKDNPSLDVNNPNASLRARSTVGIVIIWKLKFEDNEYSDGYVYNPRDGKTYRIEMKMIDKETVKIRGYMGISLLGQSQIWKRAHGDKKPAAAK